MRKCLIVQFEPRHEEVIPAVISACNSSGYRPTVLLNRRIKRMRGDLFELVAAGDADIRYEAMSRDYDDATFDWAEFLTDDVDFVLLNTFNRAKTAAWAKTCGKPVIAVIHNVDQFTGDAVFHDTLNRPDFAFLTLAPHVTSELISRLDGAHVDRFGQIAPIITCAEETPYKVAEPRKVVVQGNVSLRTRDFEGLIDVLARSPGKWGNLTFEIPSSGADRDAVAAQIKKRGLDGRMRILPCTNTREVSYQQVFQSFQTATMFHPLIPAGFAKYQRTKITSTASMSVSFGIPVIMDRWSEACYRFPMLVSDNTLEASLDRLSQVDGEELQQIHTGLIQYRARMKERSASDMRRLVAQIL